ncbi:3-oxoacyl-reductase [Athelia psychrophila]|uniref:3-oxoacyl-reductase n=1 Tax=Athelia psychrophila TaxID=1759441 RepID=A0A166XED4_9AGAM|nr:3-oxoacyl-reductase [Fibularhizoctonia sp. CBS 109695]
MSLSDIFGLQNKVGFITGAASGLGAEMAQGLALAGADVVLADINAAGAELVAKRIRESGRKALVFQLDVSKEDEVEKVVQAAVDQFGHIDILFNNAGVAGSPGLVHEMTTEQWRKVISVDLDGVFYVARAVLKVMMKQGSGKIINTASMWGLGGSAGSAPLPAYCAAKGAVVNLTREMGLEYAKHGITVNAICPGTHRTAMVEPWMQNEVDIAALVNYVPMGRISEASEIRGPAIFLASSASNFMTGQTLVVDGGCLAGPGFSFAK